MGIVYCNRISLIPPYHWIFNVKLCMSLFGKPYRKMYVYPTVKKVHSKMFSIWLLYTQNKHCFWSGQNTWLIQPNNGSYHQFYVKKKIKLVGDINQCRIRTKTSIGNIHQSLFSLYALQLGICLFDCFSKFVAEINDVWISNGKNKVILNNRAILYIQFTVGSQVLTPFQHVFWILFKNCWIYNGIYKFSEKTRKSQSFGSGVKI